MVRKGERWVMNEEILFFFDQHMDALPLFERFAERVKETGGMWR